MIGYAFVKDKDSRLYGWEMLIKTDLLIGDYIQWYPANDGYFLSTEIESGFLLLVSKRIYSSEKSCFYYQCEHVQ